MIKTLCSICGVLLLISGLLMAWVFEGVENSLQPAGIITGYYKGGEAVFTDSGEIGGNAEGGEYARMMKTTGEWIAVTGGVIAVVSLFIKKQKQIVS